MCHGRLIYTVCVIRSGIVQPQQAGPPVCETRVSVLPAHQAARLICTVCAIRFRTDLRNTFTGMLLYTTCVIRSGIMRLRPAGPPVSGTRISVLPAQQAGRLICPVCVIRLRTAGTSRQAGPPVRGIRVSVLPAHPASRRVCTVCAVR